MTDQVDIVAIRLLDRDYQIKCPAEKVADLQEAAKYLDAKLRESTEGNKTINHERIFMIAALNIANELVTLKRQKNIYIDSMNQRILNLQNKIEEALTD